MKKKSHDSWRSMWRVSKVQFSGTFYCPVSYFPYFLRKWKRNLTTVEGPCEGFQKFNSQGLSIALFLTFHIFLENEKEISRQLKVHVKGFTSSILRDFQFPCYLLPTFLKKLKKISHERRRSMCYFGDITSHSLDIK